MTRWSTIGWALVLGAACGGNVAEDVDATVATVEPVRGAVKLGESVSPPVARAARGAEVETPASGLARISLDSGSRVLVGASTSLAVAGTDAVELEQGTIFAEVQPGDRFEVATPNATLRTRDGGISITVGERGVIAYVVRGELTYVQQRRRGSVRAGEQITLPPGDGEPRIESAVLWSDWTGGFARPGPAEDSGAEGVGMLEARVPDEIGQARWPLVIRRLDVRVTIAQDLALTEVDQVFFNPASETVEGLYRVRVPEEAVLQRFAVDRNGRLVDGYVREKEQARQAYEVQVYRGSTDDPALLEWDAPGAYRARIYPIQPGETRRIVIRYAEWLTRPGGGAPRLYRYPMGGGERAPDVQEFSFTADVSKAAATRVRAGMGATVEDDEVLLRLSDFRPRSDLWVELVDAGSGDRLTAYRSDYRSPQRAPGSRAITNEADERDFYYLPVVLPARLAGENRPDAMDLVVVADVSAATDASHLELGRSVVESLAAHLRPEDRIAIVGSDLTIRALGGEERPTLAAAAPDRIERLLDGLARIRSGGATDLGEAIGAAAELLDPARPGAVVYVGDGAPTVGELAADGLLDRFARLPHPVRLYAVAVGGEANLELLEALTRGGGLALRVEERAAAADASLRILGHAARPLAQRVTVDLGSGIDGVFPRRPMDVVIGEVLPVVGRIRDDIPEQVRVRGVIAGRAFDEVLRVNNRVSDDPVDLRLRWAGERLRQLLLEGAGREAIAELGTRYGLITPFTSYYVPSARELGMLGAAPPWRPAGGSVAFAALAIGLGFAGCDGDEAPVGSPASGSAALEATEEESADNRASTRTQGMAQEQAARDQPMAQAAQPTPAAPPVTTVPGVRGGDDSSDDVDALRRRAEESPNAYYGPAGAGGTTTPSPDPAMAAPAEPAPEPEAGTEDNGEGARNAGILGTLRGNSDGDASGFGGLGVTGGGQAPLQERSGGGTGEGTIGLGNLGTIGHGGGGGEGSGYGRGAGGFSGRDAAVPRIRSGTAEVRGSMSREIIRRVVQRHINEVRFCYEQQLNARPDLEGRVSVDFVISPSGTVQASALKASTLGNSAAEQCIVMAVRRWTFPAPDGGGIVMVTYPFMLSFEGGDRGGYVPPSRGGGGGSTLVLVLHRPRRCSDAAGRILDDRRALWRERLGNASSPAAWIDIYETAIRDCEAPTWREKRALLDLILARAGNVETMVQVYRLLADGAARGYLRAAILRRVRTPNDLRIVRTAFGLEGGVDWQLVERLIAAATTPEQRIRVLRQLLQQFPQSFDLQLRLLAELEQARRLPEARRLAEKLREDPLADAGVRTAVGEMYLRLGDEAEARRVFSEIVEFAPLDELARRRLGDLYRAHGWFEDAYRQYQTLSEIRPDDPTVFLLLAQAAAGAGRVDEALRLEQRLAETAEPGASEGVARTALLWSSVRYAKLREEARRENDRERLEALTARMRRSGVLREAGQMRVSLTWSHPDARLSLWASHPGLGLTRPTDISPEFGIEAFDVREQESGEYRIQVQRTGDDHRTRADAELVVVWNEGQADEKIQVVPLRFEGTRRQYAWTIRARELREQPAPAAEVRQ